MAGEDDPIRPRTSVIARSVSEEAIRNLAPETMVALRHPCGYSRATGRLLVSQLALAIRGEGNTVLS